MLQLESKCLFIKGVKLTR